MASSSLETEDVESRAHKRDLGVRLAAVGAPARCRRVLAQRLEPSTKEPVGAPYALYHLHRPATSPAVFGKAMFLVAARDKLILPEWTVTSNLWTAMLEPGK